MTTVTIYRDLTQGKPYHIPLSEALNRIKTGKSKEKVDQIRNTIDKERQDGLKKLLPAVCFSGKFGQNHTDSSLIKHSGYIVLDFDYVDSPEEKKVALMGYNYVLAVWVSPRGVGVKALVKIADGSKHRLQDVFPEIDKSGINEARLCFESYDPDIQIKKDCSPFTTVKEKHREEIREEVTDHSEVFTRLVKWLTNKGGAFRTGERNFFVFRLATACNAFGIPEEHTVGLIMYNFVGADDTFGRKECERTVRGAYARNRTAHGTAHFENERLVMKDTKRELDVDVSPEVYDPNARPKDVIYAEDVRERAMKLYDTGYDKIIGVGFDPIDILYKKRKTELTVWTGIGNFGKSTFWKWYHLARVLAFGERYAVFGPEDCPAEEFYFDFVEMIFGCDCTPKNPDRPNRDSYQKMYDFIGSYIFYVYPESVSPSPTYIKERFLELVIKEKVDGVLIDPFNQLTNDYNSSGGRSDKYLETFLSDCSRFAQQNNVYFDIIAHPKQLHKNGALNYPCPDIFDIADGAMWNNKADNIIVYHRPRHGEDPTGPACEIHTKKIVGAKGTLELEYNRTRRRFTVNGFDLIADVMKENATDNELPSAPKSAIQPNIQAFPVSSQDGKELLEPYQEAWE
jgi:hypothetical protein